MDAGGTVQLIRRLRTLMQTSISIMTSRHDPANRQWLPASPQLPIHFLSNADVEAK